MLFLRSVLFSVAFWVWGVGLLASLSPPLLTPGSLRIPPAPIWGKGVIWLLRWITGITHEVRGMENIPEGRVLFASKHQAAWETILIPIVIPMAEVLDLHTGLALAAAIGGGIFGDHCSPISDSTIVASMAAATDHIDHVRTQIPYALVSAAGAVTLFTIAGFVL